MDGQRGREMLRRHSTGSSRFTEIRGLYSRFTQGLRAAQHDGADEAHNHIAGDRRGTAAHKTTTRKGGGQ
jgi:hypothetical protein